MRGVKIVTLLAFLALTTNESYAFVPNILRQAVSLNHHDHGTSQQVLHVTRDRTPGQTEDTRDDDFLRQAYDSWRNFYGKGDFHQERYEHFKSNYVTLRGANAAVVKRARDQGRPVPEATMELNEYGDCSIEEYKAILRNGSSPPPDTMTQPQESAAVSQTEQQPREQESNKGSPEVGGGTGGFQLLQSAEALQVAFDNFEEFSDEDRIRNAYTEWCNYYGKEFDEDRLETFSQHFVRVENFSKESGKPVKLNEHADLSTEEYTALNQSSGSSATVESTSKLKPPDVSKVSPQATADPMSAYADAIKATITPPRVDPALASVDPFKTTESSPSTEPGLASATEPPNNDRIRHAYSEWRNYYGKDFEESRLERFGTNLLQGEQYFKETGKSITLNEYADLTTDEYQSLMSDAASSFQPADSINDHTKTDRVRKAYTEWCEWYGKSFDEALLERFASNFLKVEQYYKDTGKQAKLNEYADLTSEDLTSEEYEQLKRSGPSTPTTGADTAPSTWSLPKSDVFSGDTSAGQGSHSDAIGGSSIADASYKKPEAGVADAFQASYLEALSKPSGSDPSRGSYMDTLQKSQYPSAALCSASVSNEEQLKAEKEAEEEARQQAQDVARRKTEEEARRTAEEQARLRAEAETRRKAEVSRLQAEEEAQQKAAEQAELQVEEQTRRQAEEQVRLTAEEEARRKAEEQARLTAEKETRRKTEVARLEAEEEAQRKAAEQAKVQAEEQARRQADQQARLKAEEEARRMAEEQARLTAQEDTRYKAEVARVRAEEEASRMAEVQVQLKAEEQAKLETEEASASVLANSPSEASAQASKQGSYLDNIDKMQGKDEDEEGASPASQGSYMNYLAAQNGQDTTESKAISLSPASASYLEKVAKTWVSRSATLKEKLADSDSYLDSLQGKLVDSDSYLDSLKEKLADSDSSSATENKESSNDWDNALATEARTFASPESPSLKAQVSPDSRAMLWPDASRKDSLKETTPEKKEKERPEEKTSFWGSLSKLVGGPAKPAPREKSTPVKQNKDNGVGLRWAREVAEVAQRRNEDEEAAARARVEVQEWGKIRKILTKEAEQARLRRENEERAVAEARRKALEIVEASDQSPKGGLFSMFDDNKLVEGTGGKAIQTDPPAASSEGNVFSLLAGVLGLREEQKTEQAEKKTFKKADQKGFSLFGGSEKDEEAAPLASETQVLQRDNGWIGVLFDFFGANKRDEVPGRGTILIADLRNEKKSSVFDFFVSSEQTAPREPGRGTIRIPTDAKPSIFSFFADLGKQKEQVKPTEQKPEPEQPSMFSFLGGTARKSDDSAKEVETAQSKQVKSNNSTLFSFFGGKKDSGVKSEDDATYETRRRPAENKKEEKSILPSWFENESKKKQASGARSMGPGKISPPPIRASKKPQTSDVPALSMWTQNEDGSIMGLISNSKEFRTGSKITTSPVSSSAKAGTIVTTVSGSRYKLGLIGNAKKKETTKESEPSTLSFFFGTKQKSTTANRPEVAVLNKWEQNADGSITGVIRNKTGYKDGTRVTTSPVNKGAKSGTVVKTQGGSLYQLL